MVSILLSRNHPPNSEDFVRIWILVDLDMAGHDKGRIDDQIKVSFRRSVRNWPGFPACFQVRSRRDPAGRLGRGNEFRSPSQIFILAYGSNPAAIIESQPWMQTGLIYLVERHGQNYCRLRPVTSCSVTVRPPALIWPVSSSAFRRIKSSSISDFGSDPKKVATM